MTNRRISKSIVLIANIIFSVTPIALFAQNSPKEDLNAKSSIKHLGSSEKALQRKIAFFDFYNQSQNNDYKYLETEIGETVYQLTVQRYVYEKIDRNQWQAYLRKTDSKSSKLSERAKAQSVGQAIPADGVIYGNFEISEGKIRISGFVLSILSKEILAEVHKTINISPQISRDIREFSEQLAAGMREIFMPSDRGAVWRSAVLPGWGQMYKGRDDWGRIYGAAVGTGFAFSLFSMVLWQTANSQYRNYNPDHVFTPQGGTELIDPADAQAQFDRYASRAQTWQKITLVSIGITLAVYLWQIMDAWLFDTRHAQLGKRLTAERSDGTFMIFGSANRATAGESQVQNSMPGELSLGLGLSF